MLKLDNMIYAGNVNRRAIELGFELAVPGTKLYQIDNQIENYILSKNCTPAFKNYRPDGYQIPFPSSSCISPNDIVVHGIPGNYKIKEGDLLTIDIGTKYNGFFVDAARTRVIGKGNINAKYLMNSVEEILKNQLSIIRHGCNLLDILKSSEETASKLNVKIITDWGGHGIGDTIHNNPFIPNGISSKTSELQRKLQERKFKRELLLDGQTICIEPVITYGSTKFHIDKDNWTVRKNDGLLAAHTERCLLVEKEGYTILS